MANSVDPSDIRFIGTIAGKLTLLDEARQAASADGATYGCLTSSLSPYLAVVAAPVQLRRAQAVLLRLPDIGSVRGHVSRTIEGGAAIALDLNDTERVSLADKIFWYRKKELFNASERRAYKRRPVDSQSVLLLADATPIPCQILDISRSGAAIAATIAPKVGTVLIVGQIPGRVVRLIEDVGFAVKFISIQEDERLEELLHPKACAYRASAQ